MEIKTQRATCITTDLWVVKTEHICKHNTLVFAGSAIQAKEKTERYLQGHKEAFVWPQKIEE